MNENKKTNEKNGFITVHHADEIVAVFGDKGREIADGLAADPNATMLGLLFAGFADKK